MNNTVSINSNIIVDDYHIIDDLGLIDEAVQVDIVDALFTSTRPDWNINDPDSPYFILNKPTKTSDFINDGSDGTSRYVQFSDIPDIAGAVTDVQVKISGQYVSVVNNKIAKIDLSNYVQKEFKTGSNVEYKVLSDNNLTDTEKQKISYINTNGDGSQALTNNGTYKSLYNILSVNGVTPDANKSITITPANIDYNNNPLSELLDKVVTFKSAQDKTITLDNDKYLSAKNTIGVEFSLLGINRGNFVTFGTSQLPLNIISSLRPTINTNQSMAFLSDITTGIENHNNSENAHRDIREELSELETYAVYRLTNAEISEMLSEGLFTANQLVIPVDNGTYLQGRIYRYTGNSLVNISNYQVNNLYGYNAPSQTTVGSVGQLFFDTLHKKIYECQNGIYPYSWIDITPAGAEDSVLLQQVINNVQLISDQDGGFTAGNNYRLLDSDGMIPIERIPQTILQGMIYGGSFDGNGIITASSQAQELNGISINLVNLLAYKNYYFMATDSYTLNGVSYSVGNFALSSGVEWVKIYNSGQVISVNNKTGAVVLNASDVNAISISDLITSWSSVASDSKVPSEKLVLTGLATKQDTLSSAQMNVLNSGITSTLVTQITSNQIDIGTINSKIPTEATSSNQLADKDFVNSSINAFAAYYITKDASGNPFATKAELNNASVFYSGGQVRVPTTNDYCIVLADESKTDSVTGQNPTTRYTYQNNQWEYQYTINTTSLTATQLAALNSGITSSLVAKITTNENAILNLSSSKQDLLIEGENIRIVNNTISASITFDSSMSDSSTNGVQNKVVKSYVDTMVGDIESLLRGI